MKIKKQDYDDIANNVEIRYKKKDRQKRLKMKMAGAQARNLQTLIIKKQHISK